MSAQRRTGTREWAEESKNIVKGCKHDCRYCYARANAMRYGQISNEGKWEEMSLNKVALEKRPHKVAGNGRIMFPTAHDIFPEHINETIGFLRKWLEVGNEILIVSKPHLECIQRICDDLIDYKKKIVFRFTIGSMDDATLKFWEPNAPNFEERLSALKYAHEKGFTTSVSCEPYLDRRIPQLIQAVYPYVNDTIWVGKMNRINQRVNTQKWSEEEKKFLHEVQISQTDKAVGRLYLMFQNYPKIHWKDSIKEVMNLPPEDVG
jgi:DNA repair photolyase